MSNTNRSKIKLFRVYTDVYKIPHYDLDTANCAYIFAESKEEVLKSFVKEPIDYNKTGALYYVYHGPGKCPRFRVSCGDLTIEEVPQIGCIAVVI